MKIADQNPYNFLSAVLPEAVKIAVSSFASLSNGSIAVTFFLRVLIKTQANTGIHPPLPQQL